MNWRFDSRAAESAGKTRAKCRLDANAADGSEENGAAVLFAAVGRVGIETAFRARFAGALGSTAIEPPIHQAPTQSSHRFQQRRPRRRWQVVTLWSRPDRVMIVDDEGVNMPHGAVPQQDSATDHDRSLRHALQ